MKHFTKTLIVAAAMLSCASAAYSETRAPHGLSQSVTHGVRSSTYRTALVWNEHYQLDGSVTSTAKVGPVGANSTSFGLTDGTVQIPGATIASLDRLTGLSANPSSAQVLAAANQWLGLQRPTFLAKISRWLTSRGVSHAYFTYTQDLTVGTATGPKTQTLIWVGYVDSTGRANFGDPKLADPDPTFLDVEYWTKQADDSLPDGWAFDAAGQLRYRLLDKSGVQLTPWATMDTNGAYDIDTTVDTQDTMLQCLVDSTGMSGCPALPTIRSLMDATGASGAMLKYARQLTPVYVLDSDATAAAGEDIYKPQMAYSYEDRVWLCDKLENKGALGYKLQSDVDMLWVSPGSPRYISQSMGSSTTYALSKTSAFDVTVSAADLQGISPAGVIISPVQGKPELWTIPSPQSNAAIYLAPIRVPPSANVASSFSTSSGDTHVLATQSGDTSTVQWWSDIWSDGVYVRDLTFNVSDPSQLSSLQLLNVGYNDYVMVELNGHVVFMGPGPNINTDPELTTVIGKTGMSYGVIQEFSDWIYPTWLTECGFFATDNNPQWSVVDHLDFMGISYPISPGYNRYGPTVYTYGAYTYLFGQFGGCNMELGAPKAATVNRDLRPWVQSGVNDLKVTTIVGGGGNFNLALSLSNGSCGSSYGIPESTAPLLGTTTSAVSAAVQ